MASSSRPQYRDRCPRCPFSNISPALVTTANVAGNGVIADYVCNRGHAWSTNWSWWDGVPHETDIQRAA